MSTAADPRAAGMVDVATLAPDIRIDMRYAGSDNFIGERIAGYDAPRCYLLRPAAEALARVQAALRARGEGLVVFDCYRPVRAVRHFVAWSRDPDDQRNKARYYPNLDKSALLGVYIAERSGHSRGATLDVGLLRCTRFADRGSGHGRDSRSAVAAMATPTDGMECDAVDMGTAFDLFDPRANTAAPGLGAVQRANRDRLLQAMAREGFENYPMEWWHYTFRPEPTPDTAYDFPVR